MRRIAAILAIVGTLMGVAACGAASGDPPSEAATFTVHRGAIKMKLTESGTLQARNKVDIHPNIKTGTQILSIVDEGTEVKKGDVLVELDKEAVQKKVEQFQDSVIQLDTDLKNAKTDLDIQNQQNESDIDKAKLDLELAKLDLDRYKNADYPQKEKDLQFQIQKAQSEVSQAQQQYDPMPKLRKEGFVTEVDLEQQKLALDEAKRQLETAKLALDTYEKYTHPMDLKQKNSAVTEAQRELKRVEARAEARSESKGAVVRQRQRQDDVAREKLKEANQELANLTIRAPQAGIVIYGGSRRSWRNQNNPIQVGTMVYPGQTIIELPDLSRMDVQLQVHQADVGKLDRGQVAWITFPGVRQAPMKGKVWDIASVAQSQSWRDPIRRFQVIVRIDGEVHGLKPGVTAECEIQLGDLTNVLFVPLQAVSSSSGAYYVYIVKNGKTEHRQVSLGRASEQYVEVTKGLAEGDKVLLVNPESAASSGNGGGGNGSKGKSKSEERKNEHRPQSRRPARRGARRAASAHRSGRGAR